MENIFFPNLLYFWFFYNSLKSRETGIFEVPLISFFAKLWGESLGHSVLVGKRAWLKCQFSRKRNVHTFITILCQFKWRKKQQNFPGVVSPARHPNCLWDKRNLFANASFCSDRSWYFDECAWRLHCIPFFGQPDFCLIFILSKNNNVFQSGALLKIPPSSLFMEELGLDIQKKISLEQRLIFPEVTKRHWKMQFHRQLQV